MMKRFRQNLCSELFKIGCTKVCRIVTILVTVMQGFLAYISAKQILSVGLDAVPDASNGLLEAMPPIEYMGFDVIMFSTIPMIVFGATCGASEYKLHGMRTTLLYLGDKKRLYAVKLIATTLFAFTISLVSVITTITITHLTLGKEGLVPLVFNVTVWKFIIMAVISITLTTLLSYVIGFLFRTAVVPLLFLIIQAYNVGDMIAEKFKVCRLLPVSLANRMIASSESMLSPHPVYNTLGLFIWIVVFAFAGFLLFRKSDLRGEY